MLELLAPTITIDQRQETYYISLVIFPIWIKITAWNYGTKMYPKKKKCQEFFKIMQKTPHQMQITFRTLHFTEGSG